MDIPAQVHAMVGAETGTEYHHDDPKHNYVSSPSSF
jgi:hypothetical protein